MDSSTGTSRRFMLALCVYREARGESALGKRLVAQVIINRSTDVRKRWPRTIVGVITQRKQFSSFNPDDLNAAIWPKDVDLAWEACVQAVDEVLSSPTPITNANHYHTTVISPSWADKTKIVETEGNHVFYAM